MKLSDFDYTLPPELIAQHPADDRDGARLFAHDIGRDQSEHLVVRDLEHELGPGDLLVVNDTRVLPSRLLARRESGGRVELLLLEPIDEEGLVCERPGLMWRALCKPARKLRVGERVRIEGGGGCVRMLTRPLGPDGGSDKTWHVELEPLEGGETDVGAMLERVGRTPLPPYIQRSPDGDAERKDRGAYQTVYAEHAGAVAAPTAGLHFTSELLARLERRGVRRAAVTLHVGHGTFLPIEVEDVWKHHMHAERFELSPRSAQLVNSTRAEGGRIVAVGTTSVRVLESCAGEDGQVVPRRGETRLYLLPGSPLRVVDALLTNFHLPRSSLLLLVSAFAGHERVMRLYREAVERRYRFFSYGDAMLLMNRPRTRETYGS